MQSLWNRFKSYLCTCHDLDLSLDISRMRFPDNYIESKNDVLQQALKKMQQLDSGSIANPDENRQVGHYWLRNPKLAPTPELTTEIEQTLQKIKDFTSKIHNAEITPPSNKKFTNQLIIGIGGSALGPQWIADALSSPNDKLKPSFFDNTDPEGMQRTLDELKDRLPQTLVIVISKSGSTPETRNGMLYAQQHFKNLGLDFAKQAVAITGLNSQLHQTAISQNWLETFPMWDWVGGRTSELSAVGLLPAALQGIDIDAMLDGARKCDEQNRTNNIKKNPAALMALMWLYATNGKAEKDLVILPYKDRLLLLSRYLQQLIMESLGKETDLDGKTVHQGLSVYGNKGSTDQHAYVQQLREGVPNFFVTFIKVLESGGQNCETQPQILVGDYLLAFLQGTAQALYENNRDSMIITIPRVSPFHIGALIALFERSVGIYAYLVNINAYHQPGVEAGKKAANAVLQRQLQILETLSSTPQNADQIAKTLNADPLQVYDLLNQLAANKIIKQSSAYLDDFDKTFTLK